LAGSSISVIIPTRDRPDSLRQAVVSVCAGSLLPAEVLVVDDSAVGGAEAALRSVMGSTAIPIRVLRGEGRGPGAARNAGLAAAAGDLVAFLDDDDLWFPQKLAWQVGWFSRRADLGILGTEAARLRYGAAPAAGPGRRPRRVRWVSRAQQVRANRLTTSSVLARRGCLVEAGGFDESLLLAQDWELWLRVSRRWRVAVLPARLVAHRLHRGQRSARMVEMRRYEAEVVGRVAAEGGALRGVARRRLAWAQCRLGRALLREHNRDGAADVLRRSLALWPLMPAAWSALARCALARLAPAGARES
jgi:glycosyltransferase involved in cell wall biosynthesis